MNVLAIETSCDETAVAVVTGEDKPKVIVNLVSSQLDLHQETHGIVPEVAARAQLETILPLLERALKKVDDQGITKENFDLLAVTKAPGLIGSLLVGVETAKTLAALWNKPLYGLHHLEGHIYAAFEAVAPEEVKFPFLALIVSGGHTQLVLMPKHFQYQILGSTRDDAAGEAFDKIARLLGLGYPGGPAIAEAAERHQVQFSVSDKQSYECVNLPRPMINEQNFDFSFAGLKTAVLYHLSKRSLTPPYNFTGKKRDISEKERDYLAAETQRAIVEVLVAKAQRAVKKTQAKTLLLVGGVSANELLRTRIEELESKLSGVEVVIPPINYSTDNAAMIGLAAWHRAKLNQPPVLEFEAKPKLQLTET